MKEKVPPTETPWIRAQNSASASPSQSPEVIIPPGQTSKTNALEDLFPNDARLGKITELLMQYWAVYKKPAPTLQDSLKMAGPGEKVELRSPHSGKPYVYFPEAMNTISGPALLLYDPTPPPHVAGSIELWSVVLVSPPGKRGQGPVPDVKSLPESELKKYLNEMPLER